MNTEALAVPQPLVHLVARNPVEMQQSQSSLAGWLRAKIAEVELEGRDYQEALELATKNKWNKRGLQKAVSGAFYRKEFYEKTLAAVDAGFTIIPEFPVDVFAIRVQREEPEGGIQSARYGKPSAEAERAEILPQGAGRYVSPTPKTLRRDGQEKDYTLALCEPTALQPVEFPIRSARPEIMSATAEAMAMQLFDEIGICPPSRKPDPLIIGRICLPNSDKAVSFLVAWHLRLSEL